MVGKQPHVEWPGSRVDRAMHGVLMGPDLYDRLRLGHYLSNCNSLVNGKTTMCLFEVRVDEHVRKMSHAFS